MSKPTNAERLLSSLVIRSIFLALAAGAITAGIAHYLPDSYCATGALLLSPSPLNQPENRTMSTKPDTAPAAQISFLMPKPLSAPAYEILLRNDEIVEQLREKIRSMLPMEHREKEILRESVRKAMEVSIRVLARTSNQVEYQPIIELSFTWDDPAIAAAVVNKWAELGVALSEDMVKKSFSGTIEFLDERLQSSKLDLDAKEAELQTLETTYDVDGLTKRLAAMQEFLTTYKADEVRLAADVARAEGEATKLTEDLANIPEKLTMHKAPPDEAYWIMSASAQGQPDASKVLISEEANTVYATVKAAQSTATSILEGLLKKKEIVAQQIQSTQAEILDLQKTLAEQKRLRTSLERQIKTCEDQYLRIAVNFEGARVAQAQSTPDIKLAYTAAIPEMPAGTGRLTLIAAVALFAAMIPFARFALVLSLRSYAARLEQAQESTGASVS